MLRLAPSGCGGCRITPEDAGRAGLPQRGAGGECSGRQKAVQTPSVCRGPARYLPSISHGTAPLLC